MAVAVGPMTTETGLGVFSAPFLRNQNIEARARPAPDSLLAGLPRTTSDLDKWLQQQYPNEESPTLLSSWLLGFVLGLKRDHRAEGDPPRLLPPILLNVGQEEDLFRHVIPVVAQNVFIFHDKGSTLKDSVTRNNVKKHHGGGEVEKYVFDTAGGALLLHHPLTRVTG